MDHAGRDQIAGRPGGRWSSPASQKSVAAMTVISRANGASRSGRPTFLPPAVVAGIPTGRPGDIPTSGRPLRSEIPRLLTAVAVAFALVTAVPAQMGHLPSAAAATRPAAQRDATAQRDAAARTAAAVGSSALLHAHAYNDYLNSQP